MSGGSRARILKAAREEFAGCGFAGARTQRIAESAGVNKQLLFYYFGSKQGLYEAVLEEAGAALAAPERAEPATGPDQVRRRLVTALERALEDPEVGLLVARGAQASDGIDAVRRVAAGLVSEVRAAILAGQGIGYFRDDANPELTAEQAVVLILGFLAFEPALAGAEAGDRRRAWLDGVAQLVIRGLTW